MASASLPISLLLATVVLTSTSSPTWSLSYPLKLEISTISAAPALLPEVPTSSPSLPPDITPLLPSPKGGDAVSPSGSLPTIPSTRSPPNPDAGASMGPGSALSPAGGFDAMAASNSVSASGDSLRSSRTFVGLMVFFWFFSRFS